MKSALHLLLTVTLLAQGAMAAAMGVPEAAASAPHEQAQPAAAAMPCHGAAADKQAVVPDCCQSDGDCAAMCAAPAVPATLPHTSISVPGDAVATTEPGEVHSPHRLKLLRPPIAPFA